MGIRASIPWAAVRGKCISTKSKNWVKLVLRIIKQSLQRWAQWERQRYQARNLGGRHTWGMEGNLFLSDNGGRIIFGSLRVLLFYSMCIVNDILTVGNARTEETQSAFSIPEPTPTFSSLSALSQEQQELVQIFSTHSEISLQWSQKWVLGIYGNKQELGGQRNG